MAERDRAGDFAFLREARQTRNENGLPAFSFRNASPHDLQGSAGRYTPPYRGHPGLTRASNAGDDSLNRYEQWLLTQENGQCVLNEFMSLTGAQQSVILNDYTNPRFNQLQQNQVAEGELAAYAAQDNLVSQDPTDALVSTMNTVLPVQLGSDWDKKYQSLWGELTPAQQASVGQQYLASSQGAAGGVAPSKDTVEGWIKALAPSTNPSPSPAPTPGELGLLAGVAGLVALGVYLYWE